MKRWTLYVASLSVAFALTGCASVGAQKPANAVDATPSSHAGKAVAALPALAPMDTVLDPNIHMDSAPFGHSGLYYSGFSSLPKMVGYDIGSATSPDYYLEIVALQGYPSAVVMLRLLSNGKASSPLEWGSTSAFKENSNGSITETGTQSGASPKRETGTPFPYFPGSLYAGEKLTYKNAGATVTELVVGHGTLTLSDGVSFFGVVINRESLYAGAGSAGYDSLSTVLYAHGIGMVQEYLQIRGSGKAAREVYTYAGTFPAENTSSFAGFVPFNPKWLP